MRGSTRPLSKGLQTMWLRKSFLIPSTARDFSNQIIKSPSLVSLDITDAWHSDIERPDQLSAEECRKSILNNWKAKILYGRPIAEGIRSRIASEIRQMKKLIGQVPGLAVILVGERRDSQTYVRNKTMASEEAGIKFKMVALPESCSECEVSNVICKFNEDPSFHGIIVQLPLPQHLDVAKILNVVSLEKDVDGFHPLNIGNLAMQGMEPLFVSCTPKGCIELLLQSDVELIGKKVVVIGRSNIVGLPMSLLLQRHHATVTVLHEFSKHPEIIAREADILIAAAGLPNFVRGSWLKPGAVVVDIGTNPIEDPESEHGYRLIGDVCFEEARRKASAITPVPGGVGPMTVAMLLYNTLESAKRAFKLTHQELLGFC